MISKIFFSFLLICVISLTTQSNGKSLPPWLKTCKRTDPNLEKCVIDLIRSLEPRFSKGIPEMHVPPLDPFRLPEVKVGQGRGSVNFEAVFKNIVAQGAKNFNVTYLKFDLDSPSIAINITFPKLLVEADYNIKGKILVVPINGIGKANANLTNAEANLIIYGKYDKRNGKNYLAPKSHKVVLKLEELHLHFDNLFNGNKELSDSTNRFLNENWKDIMVEINPLIEDTLGQIMLQLTKGFLELYSIEDLLPQK